ncbi:MAG TPA: DUF2059 domain-containing protein [Pyrinomonadaceae bacterium]|jgi:hypothetical protein|nr:DUF2059 domain-containing protein [Pyrinomonadaceae bacterium]
MKFKLPVESVNMKLSTIVLTLCLICCAGITVKAQNSAGKEKEQAIRRLLKLTKAGDLGTQILEQSLTQLRPSLAILAPDVQEKIGRIFEEEMRKDFSSEQVVELIIPIYDKYLSLDDLNQLIAIYESPIGQKLINVLPQITRESFESGANRGGLTAERIKARIEREGLLPSLSAPPPEAKPARTPKTNRPRRKH